MLHDKEIFSDIPYEPKTLNDPLPQDVPESKPAGKSKRKSRPKKQAVGKVSCTFHLPESIRSDLQALSFMTSTPQNELVENALTTLIRRKGIELPQPIRQRVLSTQ